MIVSAETAVFDFIDQDVADRKFHLNLRALEIVQDALANEARVPADDLEDLKTSKRRILDELAMYGLKRAEVVEPAAA